MPQERGRVRGGFGFWQNIWTVLHESRFLVSSMERPPRLPDSGAKALGKGVDMTRLPHGKIDCRRSNNHPESMRRH